MKKCVRVHCKAVGSTLISVSALECASIRPTENTRSHDAVSNDDSSPGNHGSILCHWSQRVSAVQPGKKKRAICFFNCSWSLVGLYMNVVRYTLMNIQTRSKLKTMQISGEMIIALSLLRLVNVGPNASRS